MKKIHLFLVFLLSFIYMEFLYKFLIFNNIWKISIINMLLFLIPFSLFLSLFTNLTKSEKANRIIFSVILAIVTVWFCAEYVVKSYFDCFISWGAFGVADQIGDFMGKAVVEILRRIPGILMFFIPFILTLIFHKYLRFRDNKWYYNLIIFGFVLSTYGFYLFGLNINKNTMYSAHQLYYDINDINLNMESLGVLNSFCLDTKRAIFGFEAKIVDVDNPLIDDPKKDDTPIVYEYNNLDIDFNSLMNNEKNSTIKELHEYFSKETGTLQNEYTGMFKDKNLILFMAESFNEIAVFEELTPTLYKLVHSGFVFNNFYTPTIFSTIGGEFQELTGIYAQSVDILTKFRTGNVSFPQGIATKFKVQDYHTYAFHNNSYTFQSRDKYLKSLGFDNFLACNNGLEKRMNCNLWPRSDLEMINATVDDYINEDKFMVFYASNSGHSSYDSFNANQMAKKNRAEYEKAGFNYSTRVATYLAAQMELDKALEALIKKLDESGRLEDTVIALVGDHHPYDLKIEEINEVASYKKDSEVEVNHSNFILWNSEMDTINIDKVGSQIDVMPTIYNVFGIPYDSRLFIGKDILSTDGGLAIFGNKSWVSDKGTYYLSSNKFVPREGVEVDDDYVKAMNKLVNNKVNISRKIIMNNYYSKVF